MRCLEISLYVWRWAFPEISGIRTLRKMHRHLSIIPWDRILSLSLCLSVSLSLCLSVSLSLSLSLLCLSVSLSLSLSFSLSLSLLCLSVSLSLSLSGVSSLSHCTGRVFKGPRIYGPSIRGRSTLRTYPKSQVARRCAVSLAETTQGGGGECALAGLAQRRGCRQLSACGSRQKERALKTS